MLIESLLELIKNILILLFLFVIFIELSEDAKGQVGFIAMLKS
jgi:hypothetical protein